MTMVSAKTSKMPKRPCRSGSSVCAPRVGDGRGTHARLVGEHAALHAAAQRRLDADARRAAERRARGKGRGHDVSEGADGGGKVQEDDRQRHAGVKSAHQRHQPFRRPADARRAAHQRQRDRQRKQKPHEQAQRRFREGGEKCREGKRGRFRGGVGLHHVADAEGGQRSEQGKEARERGKAPAQSADIVHRPAVKSPVRRPLAIAHGEDDFGILRGHAEKGRHPHPEHRARPAQSDGPGDAGDIARAHRGRQRRRHRLQRRYFPVDCAFSAGERAHGQAQQRSARL